MKMVSHYPNLRATLSDKLWITPDLSQLGTASDLCSLWSLFSESATDALT